MKFSTMDMLYGESKESMVATGKASCPKSYSDSTFTDEKAIKEDRCAEEIKSEN